MKKSKIRSATVVDGFIGEKIKLARTHREWSQSDLGKALGVSFQMVQKMERGSSRVAASRLLALAYALGKPVTFFVPDDPASLLKRARMIR